MKNEIQTEIPGTTAAAADSLPVVQEVTAEQLAGPLAETMPEPTAAPAAPAAPAVYVKSDAAPAGKDIHATAAPEIRDGRGIRFDPSRHAADVHGNPRLNRAGNFFPKTIGRPGGRKTTPAGAPVSDADQPDAKPLISDFADPGAPDRYDHAARLYLGVGLGLVVGVFSDEWKPDDRDEFENLRAAVARVLRENQTVELSATSALWVAVLAYAAKRASRPRTREILGLWWHRLKNLFTRPQSNPEA